jgi:transcriptional regulator with XRE-family HTH domain
MTIGQKLKQLREKEGWSQAFISESIGMKREYVCRLETGNLSQHRNPTLKTLERLRKVFKLGSISELLEGVEVN